MRILVLSDSHGCVEPMEQCVERVQPQVILHLVDRSGDFWVMNPGCIGPSVRRTYGVITLEDGKVDCAAFRL